MPELPFDPGRLDLFWRFVCERQRVWHRRNIERLPPPWTDDPVLQREWIINIYRELDPGTKYVITEILERPEPAADRIFNVVIYRIVGRKETHAALGFQRLASFDSAHFTGVLGRLREQGQPPFTAAYMVSGYAQMGTRDKAENIARLLCRIRDGFGETHASLQAAKTSEEAFLVLRSLYGLGGFLAYQILVDLRYPLAVEGGRGLLPFSNDDWVEAGPGAKKGIAMILLPGSRADRLEVMRWCRDRQHEEFRRLGLQFPFLKDAQGAPVPLSLANIQGCFCEFHKYVKIREQTGRGRRKFTASSSRQLP